MSPSPHLVDQQSWLSRVCGDDEMGRRVLTHDWASTPLGPPDTWSQSLRTAVGVCMTSRFPMLVVWGPDLVKIYNDGYRPMLGSEKHPRALGAPAREIWPEVWDIIGPMFEHVISTGEPTWHEHELLLLERNGFTEECYFTWSYSPLFDDTGAIRGVLDVVTEVTNEVIAGRRLACVSALSAALVSTTHVTDVCLSAAATLARHTADVGAVDLYLRAGEANVLLASSGRDEPPGNPPTELDEVMRSGHAVRVGAHGYLVPIGTSLSDVRGVMAVVLNPQRPFDATYREFIALIGDTIGTALDNAYRRAVEVGEFRAISDTLQAAMLRPASDLPTVAARYVPAAGNLAVGGDWYDVIDLGATHRGVVVGDCVGHGLDAATVMGQLRSAARAMLLEGRDPAATLEGLDAFAGTLPGAEFATVVCAVFDRQSDVVTYARAGHPPPLVVSDDGVVWLDGAGGVPLMANRARPRVNASYTCRPGDRIVLYTDGFVERRGEVLDVGFDRLVDAIAHLRDLPVQQLADGLLHRLLPEPSDDDVVLVVKQLPVVPPTV